MTSWADVGHGKLKAEALQCINFPSLGLEESFLDLFSRLFANLLVCVLQIGGFL